MKWKIPTKIAEVYPAALELDIPVEDPELNVPVVAYGYNPNSHTGYYMIAALAQRPMGSRWFSDGKIIYAPLLWHSIELPEGAEKGFGIHGKL